MSRSSRPVTAWAIAGAGVALAVAALVTVLLLSGSGSASASGASDARFASRAGASAPGWGSPRGVSSARASSAARPRVAAVTVGLAATRKGQILVGPRGQTLYAFSRDSRNRDRCVSIPGCSSAWPALTTSGRPHAAHGLRGSLLGTILVHGRRQVTYAGHPLYTYAFGSGRAETDYIGANQDGGTWPALDAAGRFVN